jgi:hypothetical protein
MSFQFSILQFTINAPMNAKSQKYDLEERTAQFGEAIILLCKKVYRDEISKTANFSIITLSYKHRSKLHGSKWR